LSSQTGEGPGISSLRDTERFRTTGDERKLRRVVVGQFGGLSGIARLISRALRDAHEIVMLVDEPDVSAHVLAANCSVRHLASPNKFSWQSAHWNSA
jgi:N-acetylmuramoyl-L-alanine amidase